MGDKYKQVATGPIVFWHPVVRKCFIDGEMTAFPVLGTGESGYLLLKQIEQMPDGRPIGFADALRLAWEEIHKQMNVYNNDLNTVNSSTWIANNLPKYWSANGWKIKLKGDEMEFLESEEELAERLAA
jgi:hypothetical protein